MTLKSERRTDHSNHGDKRSKALFVIVIAVLLAGCDPSDRRPGLWLSGEAVAEFPSDWSFTDTYKEIYLEVATPYFIPHSVTIWCAQVDGNLFIGAREPDTKNWPGWMEKNREIQLKIDGKIYDARARDITDDELLADVRAAYVEKYQLTPPTNGVAPEVRYWSVVPSAL